MWGHFLRGEMDEVLVTDESLTKSAKVSELLCSPSLNVVLLAEPIGVIALELMPPVILAPLMPAILLTGFPLLVKFRIYCSSYFCVSTIRDMTCSFYSSLCKRICCSWRSLVSSCSTKPYWSSLIPFITYLAFKVSIGMLWLSKAADVVVLASLCLCTSWRSLPSL